MKEGDLVVAAHKGGAYVGELLLLDAPKAKVRMLAVLKHPTQGDLHHPNRTDVAMFHERRALAYREVANVFARDVSPYDEPEAPDYRTSLLTAVEAEMDDMRRLGNEFGRRALQELERLAAEYAAGK
ncbi:kinase-associated lipoprotein B [Paenibacillus sp. TRM 82003]|nr:kinase-associated lipoprotein B [Paenibacillus sp. TRM 82003]